MWVSRSLILIMFGYFCEITNSINTYLQFMQTFASLQGLNLQPYVSQVVTHPAPSRLSSKTNYCNAFLAVEESNFFTMIAKKAHHKACLCRYYNSIKLPFLHLNHY